jgi:choline dehydrogenase-like flavoprotein
MRNVVVVGSGPSGVHLAETLLESGQAVTMLDVGHEKPLSVLPEADFDGLKSQLDDPVLYFLGADARAVVFPSDQAKYFSFPPSKGYVFAAPPAFAIAPSDFEPLVSFAAGGLAEAWTGGCYPLNEVELADFPFDFQTLEPYYARVIRRIGVTAARDDLAKFSAWFDDYLHPLDVDPSSASLLENYARHRIKLNSNLRFYLGRSRVAVLTREYGDRSACDNRGRCLWGCPRDSLYSPSATLRQLRRYPQFRYIPGAYVTHFSYKDDVVSAIVATTSDGTQHQFRGDVYALAAGTLCSSKILLDSIFRCTGEIHALRGLMDNRQIVMPFLSVRQLGRPVTTRSYQFHQIALGIEQSQPEEYVHGQITMLKAASLHPIAQNIPLDLRSALTVFRKCHAALGAANVWLHDRRDERNLITIRPRFGDNESALAVQYAARNGDRAREVIGILKRALRKLGCIVPPGMTKILPAGHSVHYAGTVPMRRHHCRFGCTRECRSHDFRNLYFADGTTFPFLPAKNLTFTLMANAIRVGQAMIRELQK